MLAALGSRAASTTMAGPGETNLVNKIKIRLKYSNQHIFLQLILSATTLKSIFHFRICIPNLLQRETDAYLKVTKARSLFPRPGANTWHDQIADR